MLKSNNNYPLADFNLNAKEHVRRLKETGEAEILTIDGQAEVIVQSAEAYLRLVESAERAETLGRGPGLLLTPVGQGRVGVTLPAPGGIPFGLAVADDEDARRSSHGRPNLPVRSTTVATVRLFASVREAGTPEAISDAAALIADPAG